MDKNQEQLLEIAQAIAVSALEAPPDKRTEFIERTIEKMCEIYNTKQGRPPITAHQARKLLELTTGMVRRLEACGGTVGRT